MKQSDKSAQMFDEFRQNISKEAEEILSFKLMDNKAKLWKLRTDLDLLGKYSPENVCKSSDAKNKAASSENGEKGFKYPSNHEILQIWAQFQSHSVEFNATANTLIAWLELQKRKQETGNTFGSEVIDQITGVVSEARGGLGEHFQKYLEDRVKLVGKLTKYPGSEDGHKAIAVLDYNIVYNMDVGMVYLDRAYGIIYDKLKKNWDTIAEAGSSKQNCDVMY